MENSALHSPEDERESRPGSGRGFDLDQVRNAVKGIRYGEVRVIIQDGVVVQIERVEKQRLR
jgi:hypothetical protein